MNAPLRQDMAAFALELLDASGVRFEFPYMARGFRAPNPQPILLKTIRSAITAATGVAGDLPVIAGGKSLCLLSRKRGYDLRVPV